MQMNVVPTDGMIITEDTHFAAGVYVLPNGIEIGADNVTLDGCGAELVSPSDKHTAIRVRGRKNIAIRDIRLSGFYHGIR